MAINVKELTESSKRMVYSTDLDMIDILCSAPVPVNHLSDKEDDNIDLIVFKISEIDALQMCYSLEPPTTGVYGYIARYVKILENIRRVAYNEEKRAKTNVRGLFNSVVFFWFLTEEFISGDNDREITKIFDSAILAYRNYIKNSKLQNVLYDFLDSPASAKYHGNFKGGLFFHSVGVLEATIKCYDIYKSVHLPISKADNINFTAVFFHDMCKVGKYVWNAKKEQYDYAKPEDDKFGYSFQHGAESFRRLVHLGLAENIPNNWELAINYHMGVFGVSNTEMNDFSKITESVPEVLLLHHADMISSKIYHL